MLATLEKGICSMTVFIICAQTIVHFRPKASYEKYLKILLGIFILMLLLQAVEGFFSKQGQNFLLEQTKEYGDRLQKDLTRSVEDIWDFSDSTESLLSGLKQDTSSDNLDGEGSPEGRSSVSAISPVAVQPIQVQVHVEPVHLIPQD